MPATVNGHCMPLKDVLRHYCMPDPTCELCEQAYATETDEGVLCDDCHTMVLEDAADLAASKAIDAYHEGERLDALHSAPTFQTHTPAQEA